MNIISIQIQTNELSAKGILFMTLGNSSLLSLIGNRMFINLKEAGEQQENGGKLSLDGAAFNSNLSSIRFSSRRSAAHTGTFIFLINGSSYTENRHFSLGTSHYTAPRSFFDLDDEFWIMIPVIFGGIKTAIVNGLQVVIVYCITTMINQRMVEWFSLVLFL